MTPSDKMHHERLHDWEAFDHIELTVVPRYKTSDLSGDEWRYSVRIKLYFKGELMHERSFGDMQTAMAFLPTIPIDMIPLPTAMIEVERKTCDQVGCPDPWVSRYRIKRQTASNGEWLADEARPYTYFRKFCQAHLQRGDCSREDADQNYELIDELGPDQASMDPGDESPSSFAGVIDLRDGEDSHDGIEQF